MDRPIRPEQLTDTDLPVDFGRFTLLRVLGHGAMARVFLAEMRAGRGFRKKVALKVVRATVAEGQQTFRDALINEARLGGLLHHPNVVETYDFGEIDEQPWIAMELVDGKTLAQWLHALGRLPPRPVLELGVQICKGLAHAHDLVDGDQHVHLVHRDLKPANVMVDRNGVTKVMDFGIAKATIRTGPPTQVGQTRGTPSYMSPEQAQGRPLDHRSDLFSLGTILFECLTGTRLFVGGSALAAMEEVGRVEHHLANGDIAAGAEAAVPGLGDVLVRSLRLDPTQRFADALAFQARLEALLAGPLAGESLAELAARQASIRDPRDAPRLVEQLSPLPERETLPSRGSGSLEELSLDPTAPSAPAPRPGVRETLPGPSGLESGDEQPPLDRETRPDGPPLVRDAAPAPRPRRRLLTLLAILVLACGAMAVAGALVLSQVWNRERPLDRGTACAEGDADACLCEAVWQARNGAGFGSLGPSEARGAIADQLEHLGAPTSDPMLRMFGHHGPPPWDLADRFGIAVQGLEGGTCECAGAGGWLGAEVDQRFGTRFCLGEDRPGCAFSQAPLIDEVMRSTVHACNYFVQCDDTDQWEGFIGHERGGTGSMPHLGPIDCSEDAPPLQADAMDEHVVGMGIGSTAFTGIGSRRGRPSDSWRFQGRATILVDDTALAAPSRVLFDMAWTLVPHYSEFRFMLDDAGPAGTGHVVFPEAIQTPTGLSTSPGFEDRPRLVLVLQVRGPVLRIVAGTAQRSPLLRPGTTLESATQRARDGKLFDEALDSLSLERGPWTYQVWNSETMAPERLEAVYMRSPYVDRTTLDLGLRHGESEAVVIEALADLRYDGLEETLRVRLAAKGVDPRMTALVIVEDAAPVAATVATIDVLLGLGIGDIELTGVVGGETAQAEVACGTFAYELLDTPP